MALRWSAWLLLPAVAAAQEAAPPVIRVFTRLVDVNVIARDSRGPVAGLTADDFRIFDNGVEKKIAFFSVNSVKPPAKPFVPPAPEVYTNRPEVRPDAAVRLTVVVLDGLNSSVEYQIRARAQLLKFAREIGPRDRVAVYAMADRMRRIQDFTNDSGQLVASVERYTPNLWVVKGSPAGAASRGIPGSEALQIAEGSSATMEAMADYYRMRVTTDLMKELAQEIARVPGRKNIVWLSAGFPMEIRMTGDSPEHPTSFREEMSGSSKALARASAALYPVDVRGLVAPSGGQTAAAVADGERKRHYSMDVLAAVTGGRAFYDDNDLAAEIRGAVEDAELTYTIGFYPDPGEQDGNYHRLQIEVKRPGVQLRYREGYVAADAQLPLPEADGRDQIRDALASPVDVAGMALTVRIQPRDPKKPDAMRLTIAVPARDIDLRPPENGVVATLDVIVAQRAADGSDL
ncbi:MAG: VWA domain-containing protein, partial [Acidobacteria bacterium]|nr:VWA domain-containing protein [Acidobacteriota bacterium]